MNKKLLFAVVPVAAIVCLSQITCNHCNKIEDEESEIAEVLNGNTVKLSDGLTVHLYGVDPNNAFTEDQLKNVYQGKTLRLCADSEGDQEFCSYDDEVWAYATVAETGQALNRALLTHAGHKAYNAAFLSDSLEAYNKIFEYVPRPLDPVTLAGKLKGASMLVYGEENGQGFIGTAFFINDEGLAISNNHVVHPGAAYAFYLSDPQGNVDTDRALSLNSIVYASDHTKGQPDYTIFYVNLDDNTKKRVQHLRLTQQPLVAGTKIYAVGNPAPANEILPMLFKEGTVASNQLDGSALYSVDIATTHGFSGGPVVNDCGEVIGITTAGFDGSNAQLNFATDINVVREKLDEKKLPYEGK